MVTVTSIAGAKYVGRIEATDTYTVTVTGISDLETSSVARPYRVVADVVSGPNNTFTAPPAVTLSGTVTDADLILEVSINDIRDGGYLINEGTEATITVALAAPPEAGSANNVTVQVSRTTSGNRNVLAVDKSELVFTSDNWNIPQHIIVTAADDNSPILLDRSGLVILEVISGSGSYPGIIKNPRFNLVENSQPPFLEPGLITIPAASLNPKRLGSC